MSDVDIARALERLASDAKDRDRAAAERHAALVKAISGGFASLVKEVHESLTRIEHTLIDELRRR